MRRVLAAIGAAALLVSVPGGVAAKAPVKEVDQVRDAGCSGLPTSVGLVELYVRESALYGTDAFFDLWSGDGDELVLTRDWEAPASVVITGGSVSAEIPVLEVTSSAAVEPGIVTLQGTLTEAGPIGWEDRFRNGNQWERYTGSGTMYAFEGSVTIPGAGAFPLDPALCSGSDVTSTAFVTQPHSHVASFSGSGAECLLANGDGGTGFAFVSGDESTLFVDGSVEDAGGEHVGFFGDAPSAGGAPVTFALFQYDAQTGEELPATGSATIAVVDSGEAYAYTLKLSNGYVRVSGSLLDIEGSLTTAAGTFSLNGCVGSSEQTKVVETPSNGPKPGGKRPANDLPSGAITLAPGAKATTSTRGAQLPREAEYPCLTYDDGEGGTFTVPVVQTVWYRIAGTGGQVTFDTAGSDFDTAIAVYAGSPDGAVLGCVDDTPLEPFGRTLQGSVSFATTVGLSYYVQVGGLDEEAVFGPDVVVPYGTLKVAVRAP